MDYYDELGVTRSATDVDIKKSYRKLALKFHPDKDASPDAAIIFSRVAESYDVLSDAKLKATYDLLGETGLKHGVPDGKGGKKGGIYAFEVSPLAIFEKFFGTANPYSALMDITASFEALTTEKPIVKGKQRTLDVGVTLEELYFGCNKVVQHTKKTVSETGEITEEVKPLTLNIKPGCKNGQRFVFDKEGNQKPNMEPGPVVYTACVLKHDRFDRKKDDLVFTATLPLIDALCGTAVKIDTLDGRALSVPVVDIVTSGSQKKIEGEGMPKADGSKGDLYIVFDILFPKTLSETQRNLMKAAFFYPSKPSATAGPASLAFLSAANNPVTGWTAGFKK